jgi:hypothetical protein
MPQHDLSSTLGQEMLSLLTSLSLGIAYVFFYTDSVKSQLPQVEQ